MKTKKPVAVICIVLLLSMLFTACDFSGSQKKEQIFYGDPDTETLTITDSCTGRSLRQNGSTNP